MSECSGRATICAIVLTLSLILYLATNYQQIYHFAANYQHHLNFVAHSSSSFSYSSSSVKDRDTFIEQWLSTQVSDPFNISAISNLCQTRKPNPDIIVRCAPGTGGVGNIRSYILHCVRFAIETGGSIIIPRFHRRRPEDVADLNGELRDFDHFFDRPWLKETLEKACPHMLVHDFQDEAWSFVGNVTHFGGAIDVSTINQPSPWREEFERWLLESSAGKKKPWVVESSDPGRSRDVMDDGVDFYHSFGRILQFRPDIRRLAALATMEMDARFGLGIDPSQRLFEDAYAGAHIRTEEDVIKVGWNPDFERQTDDNIRLAKEAGLGVIYAASGNEEDLERFAIKAEKEGLSLVTKHDLLSGNDLRELENLVWDQKGLLDFEILLRATRFGGFAMSSFSLNIAFRRHFLSHVENPFANARDVFVDELSRVFGRFHGDWEEETVRTMWP